MQRCAFMRFKLLSLLNQFEANIQSRHAFAANNLLDDFVCVFFFVFKLSLCPSVFLLPLFLKLFISVILFRSIFSHMKIKWIINFYRRRSKCMPIKSVYLLYQIIFQSNSKKLEFTSLATSYIANNVNCYIHSMSPYK